MDFKVGDPVKYIGAGPLRGMTGEFDRYTNKAKTRCRFFLKRNDGLSGYTGLVENLELVK